MSKERAFPSVAIDDRCGGMTLWDWYAGQALAGHSAREGAVWQPQEVAIFAAKRADAMMAERAKRAEPDAPPAAAEAEQAYDYGIFVDGMPTTRLTVCSDFQMVRAQDLKVPEPAAVEVRRSACGYKSTLSQPVLYRAPGHFWEAS